MTTPASLFRASLLAAALVAAGCGSPASGLNIESFQSVSATTASGGGITCSPSGASISKSFLYTGSAECCSFMTGLTVQNELSVLTDPNTQTTPALRVDQHEVVLDSVTSEFSFKESGGGTSKLKTETHPVFSTVQSAGRSASFIATLLTTDNGSILASRAGELSVKVTVTGHTRDGTTVKSPPVILPVEVRSDPPCPTGMSVDTTQSCTLTQGDGLNCK